MDYSALLIGFGLGVFTYLAFDFFDWCVEARRWENGK